MRMDIYKVLELGEKAGSINSESSIHPSLHPSIIHPPVCLVSLY
jgi:hypothetical protein